MAASNETRILLTAEDKTAAAFGSVSRGLKQMEDQAAMATRALGAIGVTVSAAAMVAMVKGTIDAADGFNDLSQRVGINIRQLAGWSLAANQSGTSMESVAKGIKGLSTYMVEHSDRLRAAGVTATDANGAMIQLADIFKAMPDGVEKTALAVQLFGKAGMDMIPMLNLGSAGLAEAQQKADAYGKKMAELAPLADQFNDQMEELALHSKAAGINIAQVFIPGLIGLSGWLNDIAAGGERARGALSWMAEATNSELLGAAAAMVPMEQGYKGPLDRFGLPAKPGAIMLPGANSPEEAEALRKAGLLRGGSGAPPKTGKAAAYKRSFDPEGDVEAARLEREFQEGKKRAIASDQAAEKELADLEKKRIAMEQMAEKRMEDTRLATEGEEAIREAMEKTNREIKKQDDMTRDLGLTFASAFEDAVISGKNLSGVLQGLAQDVARIFLRKSVTEPMANSLSGLFGGAGIGKLFEGMFNPAGSPIASQGFGMAGDAGNLLGFANGGDFTVGGAGGTDSQLVAFRATPGENVSVRTPGQASDSGAVTVILNISTGVAQTVRAEISNLLPSISASVQGAVMDARLRGGSTRAAYRG